MPVINYFLSFASLSSILVLPLIVYVPSFVVFLRSSVFLPLSVYRHLFSFHRLSSVLLSFFRRLSFINCIPSSASISSIVCIPFVVITLVCFPSSSIFFCCLSFVVCVSSFSCLSFIVCLHFTIFRCLLF